MLTQEEYKYLQQFDNQFNTATKSNYLRSIPTGDLTKIKEIYERLINNKYETNIYCSVCVLKLIKLVAKYYFDYGTNRTNTETKTDSGSDSKGTNKKTNRRTSKK